MYTGSVSFTIIHCCDIRTSSYMHYVNKVLKSPRIVKVKCYERKQSKSLMITREREREKKERKLYRNWDFSSSLTTDR